jgi:hypothetical protein
VTWSLIEIGLLVALQRHGSFHNDPRSLK